MKMNRIKIAIFLFAFLISFCTFALMNTRRTAAHMEQLVRQAQALDIRDNSPDETAERIAPILQKLQKEWQHHETILDIYSRHDEVERISKSVQKLEPLYNTGQYTDLNTSLYEITDALEHLMKTEVPTLANIL